MSEIKLIKSDEQYEVALARVFDLMDAEPGTDEGDELELVSTLVELYEEEQFPIDLPDPISAIKFVMEQRGLKHVDLIPYFGSRSKVSEVLSGKRNLTLKMIRSLYKHLRIPAEILLKDPQATLPEEPKGIEWDKFPFATMAKYSWIDKTNNMKDRAEEIMRPLIDTAGGPYAISSFPYYRKNDHARVNAKTDRYALQAWCIYVMGIASSRTLKGSYIPGTVTLEFMTDLAKLSAFQEGPKLAQEFLSQHGIALVVVKHLPKTHLDGAAMITKGGTPVIGMTLRYDRLDNFWFCLMHELAHIGRHIEGNGQKLFVDDLSLIMGEGNDIDDKEREADEWAEEALIPKDIWNKHQVSYDSSPTNVMALAQQLKITPAIVAGRVRYKRHKQGDKNAYRLLTKFVKNGEVQRHFNDFDK